VSLSPTHPTPLPPTLDQVLTAVEACLSGPRPGASPLDPHLVVATIRRGRLRVGFAAIEGPPPDALVGFTARPEWFAVGLVGPAGARPVTGGRPAPGPATPLLLVHLVARSGDQSTVQYRRDGAGRPERVVLGDGVVVSGEVHDHLRRALGLPTAPAPDSTAGFWASRWLEDLLARCAAGELADASWPDLVALHPVVELAERTGSPESPFDPSAGDVDDSLRRLVATLDWSGLRAGVIARPDEIGLLPTEVASWMDDGAFARHLLARTTPPGRLLPRLLELIPPETAGKLQATCRAWGIRW
jgi:hypothetical protein